MVKSIIKKILSKLQKKLPKGYWTIEHLQQLIYRKYKAKTVRNKIAFVMYEQSPILYTYHESVIQKLTKEEFDIITIRHPSIPSESPIEFCVDYKSYGANQYSLFEIIKKRIKYKVCVVAYPLLCHRVYDENTKKHIYGANFIGEKIVCMSMSITSFNFDISYGLYEYIFVPGDYYKSKYEKLGINSKMIVTGSSRYEALINAEILQEKLNLDASKKTVVWVPTHTVVSSLPDFIDIVSTLNDKFNVILKLYPMLDHAEKYDPVLSKISNCKIIDYETVDSINLINISDFVLCDYGGSAFHAIKLDKNLIFFNTDRLDFLQQVFASDSPELIIRNDIINFNKNEKERFFKSINDPTIWHQQKK